MRIAGGVASACAKSSAMNEHQASRTLLKSPPELWAECSEAQSLARHLNTYFGEIRITRRDPESTVAWEGERGSGTVTLEPSGWGTRVTLTASSGTADALVTAAATEPPVTAPATETPATAAATETPATAAATETPATAAATETPREVCHREVRFVPARAPQRPATFLARLLRRFGAEPHAVVPGPRGSTPLPAALEQRAQAPDPTPAPVAPEPSGTADPAPPSSEATDALAAALDSLGKAHHRPFSRA